MKKVILVNLLFCFTTFFFTAPAYSADGMIVGRIVVKGNKKLDTNTILHKLASKEGKLFDPANVRKDIENIYSTGYFKDIRVLSDSFEGKLALTFLLTEKPSVRQVVIKGNSEIGEAKVRDAVTVDSGSIYNEEKVNDTVQSIKKLYQSEGYYLAEVKVVLERVSEEWVKLVFLIKENKQTLIQSIAFKGNKAFSDSELRGAIETSEEWFFSFLTDAGTLKKEVLQQDVSRLMAFYMQHGYINVQVGEPIVEVNKDKSGLIVTIPVDEGEQFRVNSVRFRGNRIFTEKQLAEKVTLARGDILSNIELRNTIEAITDIYSNEGYLNTVVYPDTKNQDKDNHLVNLLFQISEGHIVHLNEIIIKGNTSTRDKVIRRQIPVGEGGILSQKIIKNSRANLNRLGFFKNVQLVPKPVKVGVEDTVNLETTVDERMTGTFSLGAGWSNVNSLMGTFSISEINFMGTGRKVSLAATLGGRFQQYNVGINDPFFLDTYFFTGFNLFFKRQTATNFRNFNTSRKGGDVTLGYPLVDKNTNNRYTRLFVKYKYVVIDISDVSSDASEYIQMRAGESTTSSITLSVRRDSRNDFFMPTKGTLSDLSLEFAGSVLGGSNYFTRIKASSGWHFPTGLWELVAHSRVNLGYMIPNQGRKLEDLSFDELFRLGGSNSIRGFGWVELGPMDKNLHVSVGGDRYLYFNFELDVPLSKSFRLAVFSDIGNMWRTQGERFNTDFDVSDLRKTLGIGIRFISPMGPIRLDYGVKMDQREGESRGNFHFAMGSMF